MEVRVLSPTQIGSLIRHFLLLPRRDEAGGAETALGRGGGGLRVPRVKFELVGTGPIRLRLVPRRRHLPRKRVRNKKAASRSLFLLRRNEGGGAETALGRGAGGPFHPRVEL